MTANHQDKQFMAQALAEAQTGLGRVAPNPSVGCLVVKHGHVIAAARTADGGRPHAEAVALERAGDKAKDSAVYVTLEPCNTTGQTGPCVQKLIDAEVARVVIACADPYQQNKKSQAVETLKAAGIDVETGVFETEAQTLNQGFFLTVNEERPLVSVKLATTLDAKIATRSGESQWITGSEARQRGHQFRAQHDAILCGIGTVIADDPLLTSRYEDADNHNIIRIVLDPSLKLSEDSQLVKTAKEHSLWVVTEMQADPEKQAALVSQGVEFVHLDRSEQSGMFNPLSILNALASKGITRLLIEGGGVTSSEFLKSGYADQLLWFRAPTLIGSDGVSALSSLGIDKLDQQFHFTLEQSEALGEDSLEIWKRKK